MADLVFTTASTTYSAYKLIKKKSNSNSFIQGASGVFGFPYTLIADGAVIFTHYEPLINQIRAIYGRTALMEEQFLPIIKASKNEIIYDLFFDKILGNIPFAGIYFNAICATAITWRLGILFSILSRYEGEIDVRKIPQILERICEIIPRSDMFIFKEVDYERFRRLVETEYNF